MVVARVCIVALVGWEGLQEVLVEELLRQELDLLETLLQLLQAKEITVVMAAQLMEVVVAAGALDLMD